MDLAPASSPRPSSGIGAFGKLPKAGDFVRVGMQSGATRALEEWMHQGVQYAHDKRGSAWKTGFVNGSVYGFVFHVDNTEQSEGIAGLIAPSVDSVGRAFPLALFTQIGADTPSVLRPLALGTFLDLLVPIVTDARELAAADLAQRLPTSSVLEDLNGLRQSYELWTRATRLSEVWRAIYATPDTTGPAYALYTLLEIARPSRGATPSSQVIGVRLPLGTLGVSAASFWLDVLRCAFRWTTPNPTFFWYFDGRSGDLLVQPGRTRPSTLLELWSPDARNDAMSDLLRISPWDGARSLLPARVQDVLQQRDASVGDLLSALWF